MENENCLSNEENSYEEEEFEGIDVENELFPYCLVWTTIPCIS